MHLFLYGKQNVGKSTLIRQALADLDLQPQGFQTFKLEDRVYMAPALTAPLAEEGLLLGRCHHPGDQDIDPSLFDRYGGDLLNLQPQGQWVLMDELGFLENRALAFQKNVLDLLDANVRIIGVIKEKTHPFLDQIKAHPQVRLQEVRLDNRDQVAKLLRSFLSQPPFLEELLGPPPWPRTIAVVGAGGKTTLCRLLASALGAQQRRVILSTTTKIFPPPLIQGQKRLIFNPPDHSRMLRQQQEITLAGLKECFVVSAGWKSSQGKLSGPPDPFWSGLEEAWDHRILEADGSRGLPIKAWAPYEPVFPEKTDLTLVLGGLSALDKPLNQVCHRYEEVCRRWKIAETSPVTEDLLLQLWFDDLNLSQRLPPKTPVLWLLNQADAFVTNQSKADRLLKFQEQLRNLSGNQVKIAALQTLFPLPDSSQLPLFFHKKEV